MSRASLDGYVVYRSGGWAILECHASGQTELGFCVNPPTERCARLAVECCHCEGETFELEPLKPTPDGPRFSWRTLPREARP